MAINKNNNHDNFKIASVCLRVRHNVNSLFTRASSVCLRVRHNSDSK